MSYLAECIYLEVEIFKILRSNYCLFDIFGTAVTGSITMYICKVKLYRMKCVIVRL